MVARESIWALVMKNFKDISGTQDAPVCVLYKSF